MSLVQLIQHSKQLVIIKLNDPDNLNAMSEEMACEFVGVVNNLVNTGKDLRAAVLMGEGKAFSAGGHLAMLDKKRALTGEANRQQMLAFYDAFLSIRKLPFPVIAALHGSAIGAGLCLATACDIRIAASGTKLGFTFTKLGLHPGMGATYFLPKVVGPALATELLLTARVIEAEEALRIGLVSKVVESAQLLAAVESIAKEIAATGPEATRQLLENLRNSTDSLAIALQREATCQSINYAGSEFAEGLLSVKEKRAPKFG